MHAMCALTASHLGVEPQEVLVASTGIIGHQLPMDKVTAGIDQAAPRLSDSPKAGLAFAHAIMTTDTRCKQAYREVKLSRATVKIAGTVKGAGMIGPNMATTLLFITTDVAIGKPLLGKALKEAIGGSLNRLTVDGHQSTNDTAILLASGMAGNERITGPSANYGKFLAALTDLCTDLVHQMALDAEGATRMFQVVVKGAATKADATKAARAVADYPLVQVRRPRRRPELGPDHLRRGLLRRESQAREALVQARRSVRLPQRGPDRFQREKGLPHHLAAAVRHHGGPRRRPGQRLLLRL